MLNPTHCKFVLEKDKKANIIYTSIENVLHLPRILKSNIVKTNFSC